MRSQIWGGRCEGAIPVLKSHSCCLGEANRNLSLSTQPLTFSTMRPHLDPNQLGILFKIPGKEEADGDRLNAMTSHPSPGSRAYASAPTPGGFISFICRRNICGAAAWRVCEIFGGHVSGAGEECITCSYITRKTNAAKKGTCKDIPSAWI